MLPPNIFKKVCSSHVSIEPTMEWVWLVSWEKNFIVLSSLCSDDIDIETIEIFGRQG